MGNTQSKTILITGGAGFVGSHLAAPAAAAACPAPELHTGPGRRRPESAAAVTAAEAGRAPQRPACRRRPSAGPGCTSARLGVEARRGSPPEQGDQPRSTAGCVLRCPQLRSRQARAAGRLVADAGRARCAGGQPQPGSGPGAALPAAAVSWPAGPRRMAGSPSAGAAWEKGCCCTCAVRQWIIHHFCQRDGP